MNVSTTIPQTVQIRRSRLLGLVAGAAVLASAITWAVLALVGDTGGQAQSGVAAQSDLVSSPIPMSGYLDGITSRPSISAQSTRRARSVRSIMELTPGDLAGGGLGGYALASRQTGPTLAEVLVSMSPDTRRYTEAVMRLTFEQLAAGAAGHP